MRFDLVNHIILQREWSMRVFGPNKWVSSLLDHIRKELLEIEANPSDLMEWVDVILLAIDGAWRQGFTPEQIAAAIAAKQRLNEMRKYPDWKMHPQDKAIEHID
jgi:hypothetical protein